jgi:hypothetical protein
MDVHNCFHFQGSPQRPAQRQAEAVGKLRSAGTSATRGGRPREAPGDSDLGRRLGLDNRSERPRRPVESGDCTATGQDLPCQRKAHSAWCQLEPAVAGTVPSSSRPLAVLGSTEARESAPPSSCRHRDSSLAVTLGRQLWHMVAFKFKLSRQSLRVIEPSIKSRLARLRRLHWHCSAIWSELSEHWHRNTKTVTPVTADATAASAAGGDAAASPRRES